ncbi:hypothetical protein K435DRAFT_645616 [Dendrothele bispora CBS 962.96]|uniref:Uncharacterized protein n=1 Tax=Dendrothele bispora (strain CBS 962.96) TaxID=1314807 RepID=A0A4S8MST2_DENBC|nr:hypothetical protein K435DRAFT_645616 [Dendrothele bispora CBS 962.96]
MVGGKNTLSATNLAAYHHFNCDLYLYNTYHGTAQQTPSKSTPNQVSELSRAQFQRGIDWETRLLSWLNEQQLLLTVPSVALRGEDLVENILNDDRDRFFISGISFAPPQDDLDRLYIEAGREPVKFGVAKPDLLEIRRVENGFVWKVIDAKASKSAKTSHQVQIYFYTLCLRYLLPQPLFQPANTASIWLPPAHGFDLYSPSFDDLKTIDTSLFHFPVDDFLFRHLPKTLSQPRNAISWHFNPMCKGCPFTSDCKEQSTKQGRLGSMSNISFGEARVLKNLIESWHECSSSDLKHPLTDIEDLATIFGKGENVQKLTSAYPITMRKAKRILALPARNRMRPTTSPIIEASRTKKIQVIQHRNYSCPRREDISVVISLLQDPSSPSSDIVSFCISIFSSITLPSVPSVLQGDGFELVSSLAFVIETILLHQEKLPTLPSTQFYVWSSAEHSALQTHLINSALASSHITRDIRLCIGALAQGASLLQTTFQPVLLSGVLMDFLSKGRRVKADFQSILDRMGLSTEGTINQLKQRIQDELQKYQSDAGRQEAEEQRRKEIGHIPRVVVLKREVERSLAFPIPGFWDLPECAAMLGNSEDCPSEEALFDAYVTGSSVWKLLEDRNKFVYEILGSLRRQVSTNESHLFVNIANPLSAYFMDICREEHLRKLFYMQQFEVLARLSELWKARIDGCPEAPILEYSDTQQGRQRAEHVFYLMSGSLDTPASEKEKTMFDYLLVKDDDYDDPDSGNNLPVEALFDDLGVSGLVFPLNRFTRSRWEAQHAIVQKGLLLADIRDITVDGSRTKVTLQTWGSGNGIRLTKGTHYRLSPRLVDFNISKVLSTLFELDLRRESEDVAIPFLQLMLDPKSFKGSDDPDSSKIQAAFRQTGTDLQKLFRELTGLGVEPATVLVLKASQNRAAQHILGNRLTVIWGPPGQLIMLTYQCQTFTITQEPERRIPLLCRFYD